MAVDKKVLEISTLHLETSVLTNMIQGTQKGFLYYPKGQYGFILPVLEDGELEELAAEHDLEKPTCIVSAMQLARNKGCAYLLFDEDAEWLEELEIQFHDGGIRVRADMAASSQVVAAESLEIHHMLALSTAHIAAEVLERMNEGLPIGCVYDIKDVTGFMLPVFKASDEMSYAAAPACIKAAIALAQRHQCSYILLDGDVQETTALPVYDHEQ